MSYTARPTARTQSTTGWDEASLVLAVSTILDDSRLAAELIKTDRALSPVEKEIDRRVFASPIYGFSHERSKFSAGRCPYDDATAILDNAEGKTRGDIYSSIPFAREVNPTLGHLENTWISWTRYALRNESTVMRGMRHRTGTINLRDNASNYVYIYIYMYGAEGETLVASTSSLQ